MPLDNIFSLPERSLDSQEEEMVNVYYQSNNIRIERIVSTGQCSPDGFWYDQEEDEWLVLLTGEAKLAFPQENITLKAGDTLLIPAHKRHRVEQTSQNPPAIWLCVFGHVQQENTKSEAKDR